MVTKPNYPHVILDTRNLTPTQVASLYSHYPAKKIFVNNEHINFNDWAERLNITVAELKKYKRECEQRFVSQRNKAWKLLTAGDDRIRALHRLLFEGLPPQNQPNWPGINFDYISHFDIDTLFRKPLKPIIPDLMEEADIWLKLRPGHPTVKARITIDCILVRPTNGVFDFFQTWRVNIDRVDPRRRPVGFGQLSCWEAFQKTKGKMNYKTLPVEFGLPGRNKKDQIIWCGNVHKLAKDDCVKLFKKEAGLK
jgi:hypothetical protein